MSGGRAKCLWRFFANREALREILLALEHIAADGAKEIQSSH
jgi:hypothetical protein